MAEINDSIETTLPGVRVLYDRILTTAKYQKATKGGILLGDGEKGIPHTRQVVVAAGPNAIATIGDEIEINFELFPRRTEYPKNGIGQDKIITLLPLESIDGNDYLFISSREIKWIYNK